MLMVGVFLVKSLVNMILLEERNMNSIVDKSTNRLWN